MQYVGKLGGFHIFEDTQPAAPIPSNLTDGETTFLLLSGKRTTAFRKKVIFLC